MQGGGKFVSFLSSHTKRDSKISREFLWNDREMSNAVFLAGAKSPNAKNLSFQCSKMFVDFSFFSVSGIALPQNWRTLTSGLGAKVVAMSGILGSVSVAPHQQRPGLSPNPCSNDGFSFWKALLSLGAFYPPRKALTFSLHSQLTPLSTELKLENLRIVKIDSLWFPSI